MIVLAENDEGTRAVIQYALRRAGHDVHAVADGSAIWPALTSPLADLLILDLRMPGMNGWEVLRRLHRPEPSDVRPVHPIPVIVISGQSDPETRCSRSDSGLPRFWRSPSTSKP